MRKLRFVLTVVVGAMCWLSWAPRTAYAWEWFRSENRDVRAGNERLQRNAPAEALPHYDRAAHSLPSEAGVHLNRGIALLGTEQFEEARVALRMATESSASREIRARAHYNLGLAFYREADRAAQAASGGVGAQLGANANGANPSAAPNAGSPGEAQRLFREARDAFRNALRQQPGYESAAWNLEITERRLREEEERERQRQEQEQQNQDQNQEQQNRDQNQDQQNQEPQSQDQQGEPRQNDNGQNQQNQNGQQEQRPENQGGNDDANRRENQPSQGNSAQQEPGESERNSNASESSGTEQAMPQDMRRVLDALEGGEQNLERARARARAQREMRRPRQDW